MAYIDWWNRTGPVTLGDRFGLNGIKRVALAKGVSGGWWGDWELNYKDQMTFEEYKKALDIDKNPSGLEKAEGGRINKKPGGLVEPGVTHYGTTTEEGPYIFKRKGKYAKKTYYHLLIEDRRGAKTKKIINEMLEATPANLKKLQKQRDQAVKKRWPDRISDEEFRKLRTSDKYKNLNNEDFAKVLDKKGYKTKFGKDWSWDRIQVKQRDLNLLGEVGYKPRRLTPEKEVLDVMKTIKGGPERVEAYIKAGRPKKMLENFRTRVNQKVYYEKYGPDLSRALEWRLKNPEKVKALSMKRFAETGLFPSGKTHKEHLWRDLWRSSQTKVGDRFKFISELPPYKINDRGNKIRNWLKDDHYKKIKFKDTKTGKTITFNNLQKYLDETIGKGTYAKSISGYELKDTLKNQKITYKGKTGTVGGLLKQNLYSPEQLAKQKLLSPFHMQHPGGVGKDWWTNEVVFSDANQKLRDLDSSLTGKLKRAKGFTEKKVLLQKYATDVEKLPGGITSVLRSKTYGITPTSTSIMEAAGKQAHIKGKNWTKVLNTAKNAKGPGRWKAVQLLIAAGISMKLLNDHGISTVKADTLKPDDEIQEAGAAETTLGDYIKGGAGVATGAAITHPEKAWELTKKVGSRLNKIISPLLTPAASIAAHGPHKPDVTSGLSWVTPAFWNTIAKQYGLEGTIKTLLKAPNAQAKTRIVLNMLLRAGIPMAALPAISTISTAVAGPLLISEGTQWLHKKLEEEGLSGEGGMFDLPAVVDPKRSIGEKSTYEQIKQHDRHKLLSEGGLTGVNRYMQLIK